MADKTPPREPVPVPVELIERRIYLIRGQKVMLDADLAEIYNVPTKRLNEAVKRNSDRFPADFMFQLTPEELENWRSQIATSNPAARMGLRRPPYAFTELGVAMLSSVLNSDHAVQMNIFIMRVFVKLRELLAGNKELARRIEQLEDAQKRQTRTQQDQATLLVSVIQDLHRLKHPPVTRAIGFIARSAKK